MMTLENEVNEDLEVIKNTIACSVVALADRFGLDILDLTDKIMDEAVKQAKPVVLPDKPHRPISEGRDPLNPYNPNQI